MKNKVKNILRSIGFGLSFLIPYKLLSGLNLVSNLMYGGYIKKQFGNVDENFTINRPIYLTGGKNIKIGKNFVALAGFRIEAIESHLAFTYRPTIFIGDNVEINHDCHIACINNVLIADNVLIASRVFITDHFHGKIDDTIAITPPKQRELYSSGPVVINRNVWIGENVSIMPNVEIGENCVIGANSVVTKSFAANSVIAGVPAKVLKTFGV
jgi:acetyltransferase-like isoleucine patch superfamily enzyme